MVPFLFTLTLVTILVVGGTVVSLFLHPEVFSGVNRSTEMQQLDTAVVDHDPYYIKADVADYRMACYTRNALVTVAFAVVVACMIVASMVNGILR